MKIEDRAKETIQYFGRLQGDLSKFRDEINLLDRHLGHAQPSF